MTTWKKVLASMGVATAAIVALRCSASGSPEMDGLPPQLEPFARKIAASRLAHVDVRPVIGPTTPWDSKLRGVPSAVEIDDEYPFPAMDEARLTFALGSSYVRPDDYRFRRVV